MMVYLVFNEYYEEQYFLGVFSTEEKAEDYIKSLNLSTGVTFIVPAKVDEIDVEDDKLFEFNRDYARHYAEKDI